MLWTADPAWRLRIEPRFGSTPVRRIRVSQVEDWLADMVASAVSASKAIEAYGSLKRVIDRALRDRAWTSNPCALRSTPLPRSMPKVRPVLSPAKVERLAPCGLRAASVTSPVGCRSAPPRPTPQERSRCHDRLFASWRRS
jgi:hypothetical protein